ncbi:MULTISPECIES: hypothetical protein [unclassified Agarivorans]|uniref:hypothetical protein n=1 Tax=unclassified Agarivorans TaxID=2636026 RepID=UPI003D7EAC48
MASYFYKRELFIKMSQTQCSDVIDINHQTTNNKSTSVKTRSVDSKVLRLQLYLKDSGVSASRTKRQTADCNLKAIILNKPTVNVPSVLFSGKTHKEKPCISELI